MARVLAVRRAPSLALPRERGRGLQLAQLFFTPKASMPRCAKP